MPPGVLQLPQQRDVVVLRPSYPTMPSRLVSNWVFASRRYLVFGKMEACRVPTGDFKRRFIEYDGGDEKVDLISGQPGGL